jgi:microcystin-dependent protein
MATSIKISGNASGTGTAIITAPSGSGGKTFTLPTTSGTVLTSASTLSSSKLSGALPAIDGSSLTGVQPFPSGTKMVFFQASAPTGWTKDTTQNNKVLRVVSSSGGGSGGSWATSSGPSHSLSAGAHTLSVSEMPSHGHDIEAAGLTALASVSGPSYRTNGNTVINHISASVGGGSSHSHSLSGSINAPQYIDVIVASKS